MPGRAQLREVGQLPKYGPGRCVICGEELTGRQESFCSKAHARLHHRLEVGEEAAWRKLDWILNPPLCACGECGQSLKDRPVGSKWLGPAHRERARRRGG